MKSKKLGVDILQQIEQAGGCQFTIEQSATLLDLRVSQLQRGEGALAYIKGKLKAQSVIRAKLYKAAQDGDTSAIKQFIELAKNSDPEISEK